MVEDSIPHIHTILVPRNVPRGMPIGPNDACDMFPLTQEEFDRLEFGLFERFNHRFGILIAPYEEGRIDAADIPAAIHMAREEQAKLDVTADQATTHGLDTVLQALQTAKAYHTFAEFAC